MRDMTDRTMKQRLTGALAVLGVGLLATGCARGEAGTSDDVSDVEQVGARVVNVEVTPVSLVGFTGFIRVTGEVEALNDITVAAEERGIVVVDISPVSDRVTEDRTLVVDGLHPSGKQYAGWVELIAPRMLSALGG